MEVSEDISSIAKHLLTSPYFESKLEDTGVPSIKLLPAKTAIYRCQDTPFQPDPAKADSLRLFFSTPYVATLYSNSFNRSSSLYSIEFEAPLRLLALTKKSIESFLDTLAPIYIENKSNEDGKMLNDVFTLFGYNPYIGKDKLGASVWEYHYTIDILERIQGRSGASPVNENDPGVPEIKGEPDMRIDPGSFPLLPFIKSRSQHILGNVSNILEVEESSAESTASSVASSRSGVAESSASSTASSRSGVAESSAESEKKENKPFDPYAMNLDGGGDEKKRKRNNSKSGSAESAESAESVTLKRLRETENQTSSFIKELSTIELEQTIRRFSSTEYDIAIFLQLFKHKFKNAVLNELFSSLDGIYITPLFSPFLNYQSFITQYYTFHEEIVLNPEVYLKRVEASKAPVAPVKKKKTALPKISPSYSIKRVVKFKDEKDILQKSFRIAAHRADPLIAAAVDIREQVGYIYQLTELYNIANSNLQESIQLFRNAKDVIPANGFHYDGMVQSFSFTLDKQRNNILLLLLDVFERCFEIHPQMFTFPADATNPFLEKSEVNEELFYFTCLSDALKAFIAGFTKALPILSLKEFEPIASGGILFGAYTSGDYRRKTKDIDLKIKMIKEIPRKDLEEKHTKLMLATHLWTYLLVNSFNTFGIDRIQTILSKYETIFPSFSKKVRIPKEFVIGHAGTYSTLDTLRLYQTLLFQLAPGAIEYDNSLERRGFLYDDFDKFLKKKKLILMQQGGKAAHRVPIIIASLEDYYKIKAKLLTDKKVLQIGLRGPQDKYTSKTSDEILHDIHEARSKKMTLEHEIRMKDIVKAKTAKAKVKRSAANTLRNRKNFLELKGKIRDIETDLSNLEIHHKIREVNMLIKYMEIYLKQYITIITPELTIKGKPFDLSKIDQIKNLLSNRPNLNLLLEDAAGEYKINYFSSLWIVVTNKSDKDRYGLIDFTIDTPYSVLGTIQFDSGLNPKATIKSPVGDFRYASILHFLKETDKLVSICEATYVGDDIFKGGSNPFNRCAPSEENRANKAKKYKERYNLVIKFCKEVFLPRLGRKEPGQTIPAIPADHLEKLVKDDIPLKTIIRYLEYHMSKGDTEVDRIKGEVELSIIAASLARDASKDKPMIGAGRDSSTRRQRGNIHRRGRTRKQ